MAVETVPVRAIQVAVDGATLHVEVRGEGPVVLVVGCPMHAGAFAPLAEGLAAGRLVVTTDPRGINRSSVVDRDGDVSPETLANDYRQILEHLGVDQVSLFGSSGGAVAALAFAQAYPELIHTVVAHEPPLEGLLDDHQQLRVNSDDMVECYLGGDVVGAWIRFFDGADIDMHPDGVADWINNRTDQQEIADEAFFFAHTLRPTSWWQPDVDALRAIASHIVIGVGVESVGQVCDRTANAIASLLDLTPTTFPGDHTGFVDHPGLFAQQLQNILAGQR